MRSIAIAAFLCAAWAPAIFGNQFNQMFRSTSHDFGTVAKAAKTEYRFLFENPYNQPIHVRSVRTSCGCTTPIIETETVAPGGQGSILARFNTGTHSGARAATVTVTFDKPSFGEVQLHVKGYIRTDVVFQPGEASFGTVSQGAGKSIQIVVDYAGKPTWQITGIRCDEKCITVEREEKIRQNGRIQYAMTVSINGDAPAGPLQSEIVLQTNDRNLTTVPIRLTANVLPEVSITPNLLSLGDINRDESIKQLLILKAQQPFRVLGAESEAFAIEINNRNEEAKTLHTLPLSLRAIGTTASGEARGKIKVLTDIEDKPSLEIDVVYRLKAELPTSTTFTPESPESIDSQDESFYNPLRE